jgi:hypothetical protein
MLTLARTRGKEQLDKELYNMQTSPSLREAILEDIFCWEDSTEYDLHQESNKFLFNEAHTSLLRAQEQIGWDKFLKGYISKEWGYIQEQYYASSKVVKKKKHTKKNWIIHLLRSLHTYRHNIWMIRNKVTHGGTTREQKEISRKQLLRLVVKLYRRDRTAIPVLERRIFHLPLHLRKKQGNQQLCLWTDRAKLLFETYSDVPICKDQQRRIAQWLQEWESPCAENSIDTTGPQIGDNFKHDRNHSSEDGDDDSEVRTPFSQMNLTNWLKSWGRETDTVSETRHLSHNVSSQQSNKCQKRDDMFHGQHS